MPKATRKPPARPLSNTAATPKNPKPSIAPTTDPSATSGQSQSPAQRSILAALTKHPNSSAADLAVAADVGRSTATKALTTLEAAGLATRTRSETTTGRRTPDLWKAVTITARPAKDRAQRAPKTASAAGARPRTVTTPGPQPQGSTAAPRAAKNAHRPPAAKVTTPHAVATPQQAASAPVAVPAGKLRKGQLTQAVMDHLHADPTREWTVRQLWHALDRSQGAISNALERATGTGTVVRTNEAPRRYRLALIPAPAPSPASPAPGAAIESDRELVTSGPRPAGRARTAKRG